MMEFVTQKVPDAAPGTDVSMVNNFPNQDYLSL